LDVDGIVHYLLRSGDIIGTGENELLDRLVEMCIVCWISQIFVHDLLELGYVFWIVV